jgi:glycosyltransferase involved in cell wall biosynthesis
VSLVSVVIPTYNRAHCIARAVDSVLAQTHEELEIVIHDDGSTDATPSLMADRYGSNPRVRYERHPNRGVSAARNSAFERVRGDFVALLDSDDVFYPWKLELQLACFRHAPEIGMVWTDMQSVKEDGTTVYERHLRKMYTAWKRFAPEDIFSRSVALSTLLPHHAKEMSDSRFWVGDAFDAMLMGSLVHTSTVMLRRSRLAEVRFFREDLKYCGEDYDFHLRTCRAGQVGFADLVTIKYEVGAADALTRKDHAVFTARNFLDTVLPIIEADRARIKLPPQMLDEVISEAHRWYAEELMLRGHVAAARPHFVKAMRLDPQLRTAALLGMAVLPAPVRTGVRTITRAMRRSR